MGKIFEYVGLISLMCFSFIITEKTTIIAKNIDEIMINIKENYKKYEIKPVDAMIDNQNIIPGSCGKTIDIDKSYFEMKKIGIYDDKLYQYNFEYPKVNLKNNYDKYIINGSSEKNYIYIFINLNENNKKILKEYNFTNYNFIVSKSFYLNNINLINEIIKKNNSILINNSNYKDYKIISKRYKNIANKNIFCYNESSDLDFLETCSSNKSNTIAKINNYSTNYLYILKIYLKRGIFYNFELNKELINSLKSIDSYLTQKGIEKSNIDNSLREC